MRSALVVSHASLDRTPASLVAEVGRAAVAFTWLYNGVVLKLLDPDGAHAAIIAQATGFPPFFARTANLVLGLFEVAVAVAVVIHWRSRLVCAVQIAALALMNGGGLLWSGELIENAAEMLVTNFCFVALVLNVTFRGGHHVGR